MTTSKKNPLRGHRSAAIRTISCVVFLLSLLILASPLFAADMDRELMNRAAAIFGPLPSSMPSPDNPITPAKVKLGNLLFWEPRISSDGAVSCAKCHPLGLFAADGLKKAAGNHCKENPRNSPTILNAAAQISAHWIGNRTSVEDQARQALVGPPSFGMPSYESVEKILKSMPGYVTMFREAFPGDADPVTADNFSRAIGAFERTLMTLSPFDDFMNGKAEALNEQQKRGLRAFLDTGCMTCHYSPYLGGQMYQKFGVFQPYWNLTKSQPVDDGRFAVTKSDADKYVFKVPILRNVAYTPPYFHDGSVDRLENAVMIMAKIQLARDLTKEQTADITAFLGSLTGSLPEAAVKVPLLPRAE
jgi:cytochrome c peroxidase